MEKILGRKSIHVGVNMNFQKYLYVTNWLQTANKILYGSFSFPCLVKTGFVNASKTIKKSNFKIVQGQNK